MRSKSTLRSPQSLRFCARVTDLPEYQIWGRMIQRCTNPKSAFYECYGGRGITIDPRWRSFEAFYIDIGPRPEPHLMLERRDNDGPYCAENCYWATPQQQGRNSRHTRLITFQGETLCLQDWADRIGIPRQALANRLRRGWPLEQALTRLEGRRYRNGVSVSIIREILTLYQAGMTQRAISRKLNIGFVYVHKIVHKKLWKNINNDAS